MLPFDGTVLSPGSAATASVSAVQNQLTARGYAGGTNGKFDAAMESVVKSVRATFDWKAAMNQFAILFGDRFTQARG